jgi:hypothetical protein
MNIVKETSRKIVRTENYQGVCDGCGVNLEYKGELIAVIVEEGSVFDRLVPVDLLSCPSCYREIMTMKIYKSLDVSAEIRK